MSKLSEWSSQSTWLSSISIHFDSNIFRIDLKWFLFVSVWSSTRLFWTSVGSYRKLTLFFCLICQWLVNFSKPIINVLYKTSKWSTAAPQRGIWFYIQSHITDVAVQRSVDLHGCVLAASTAMFMWSPECAGAVVCRLWQVYSCRGIWTQHHLWTGHRHRYSSADTQPHSHTHYLHTHHGETQCHSIVSWFLNMNAGTEVIISAWLRAHALVRVSTSRCPTWRPWTWSGRTVPAPWDAAPESSYLRWFSSFWPVCSETRFWSETRWGTAPGPGSACAARSGTGCPGTQSLTAGAAPRWRPSGVSCPL